MYVVSSAHVRFMVVGRRWGSLQVYDLGLGCKTYFLELLEFLGFWGGGFKDYGLRFRV